MAQKMLPLGRTDFKEIINSNFYYIDKTGLIEALLSDGAEVKLITRPRRFGKTLAVSMLKYFFDIREAEENRKLFNGLYIEKTSHIKEQGKYPVIFISFKDIKINNWEHSFRRIKNLLKDLYNENIYLRDSLNEIDRADFDKIIYMKDDGNYEDSLKYLTKYLYQYYKEKVVVLIDEYDTPIISSHEYKQYENSINFFRNLYSSIMKDNPYLQFGVMTGILRVAKEGIFSDLNNLSVYTVLDNYYSQFFGLTETEVKTALNYYELEYNLSEVKEWYDGYKFGNSEIYNPWSILNYISRKDIDTYWINTSSNTLINELLKNASTSLFDELKEVFNDKAIKKIIDNSSNLETLTNPQEIWQLLLYSGYLTVKEKIERHTYKLVLPNKEIKSFFWKSFIDKFLGNINSFKEMIDALIKENIAAYEKNLQNILAISMSYHDSDKNEEKFYHNLILGMILSLSNEYKIYSNRESGYGRFDLTVEPEQKNRTGFIFEFKVTEKEKELEKKALEALNQIKEKNYSINMKNNGIDNILGIGIAFCGKKIKVSSSKL